MGFEISLFTAVKIHVLVYLVATLCSVVGGHRRFGGTYCVCLQGSVLDV
jgi:hypothetical protein